MRTYLLFLGVVAVPCLALASGCGEDPAAPAAAPTATTAPSSLAMPEAKLPDLEIRGDGSERWSSCLGAFGPDDATAGDETEALGKALEAMQPALATCVKGAPPPGKLLVDVVVDADGKGKAGAMRMCGTTWELADCMHAKLEGGAYGIKTPRMVTVPIDFGKTDAAPSKFVMGASVTLQTAVKDLHACLATEQAKTKATHASASVHLDVDQTGKVIGIDLNPFEGNQDLLSCAATAIAKVRFNPVQGTGVLRLLLW
jgi:uncharacterized protein YuzE